MHLEFPSSPGRDKMGLHGRIQLINAAVKETKGKGHLLEAYHNGVDSADLSEPVWGPQGDPGFGFPCP